MPRKILTEKVYRWARHPDLHAMLRELRDGKKDPVLDHAIYQKFVAFIEAGKPVPNHIAESVRQLIEHRPTLDGKAREIVAFEVWQRALRTRDDGTHKQLLEVFEEIAGELGVSRATVQGCFYTEASYEMRDTLKMTRLTDEDEYMTKWWEWWYRNHPTK